MGTTGWEQESRESRGGLDICITIQMPFLSAKTAWKPWQEQDGHRVTLARMGHAALGVTHGVTHGHMGSSRSPNSGRRWRLANLEQA